MLIPLCACARNCFMRVRLLMHICEIDVAHQLLFVACFCNSWSWLRKWWTSGIITEWVSRPIVISNSFAVFFCSSINLSITVVQAVNLFIGRENVRCQKSQCQPRVILVS
jgi:hypothetical protein